MDPELDPTIPDYDLNIRSETITAKPRCLGTWPPTPPEPSVVDRLAARVDQGAAERVAKADAAIARSNELVQDTKDLRALWAPESPDEEWGL